MAGSGGLDPIKMALFRVTIRLSAASDTVYVLAHDTADAVDHVNKAYDDMNVLYIQAVERLAGMIYISQAGKEALLQASD